MYIGGYMRFLAIHILVVDDYEHWRRFVAEFLEKERDLQVVAEASDGLDAVRKAHKLQPDVILLDIGLPKLNGIEAARQMRQISPNSKILFFSENRSVAIVEEAMRCGARGFVLKSDAANELLPAIRTVVAGHQFVSTGLAHHGLEDLAHNARHVSPVP
jgi:DNA-binding NarL/FixJ family response regulator